jgi:hypothetical protein
MVPLLQARPAPGDAGAGRHAPARHHVPASFGTPPHATPSSTGPGGAAAGTGAAGRPSRRNLQQAPGTNLMRIAIGSSARGASGIPA